MDSGDMDSDVLKLPECRTKSFPNLRDLEEKDLEAYAMRTILRAHMVRFPVYQLVTTLCSLEEGPLSLGNQYAPEEFELFCVYQSANGNWNLRLSNGYYEGERPYHTAPFQYGQGQLSMDWFWFISDTDDKKSMKIRGDRDHVLFPVFNLGKFRRPEYLDGPFLSKEANNPEKIAPYAADSYFSAEDCWIIIAYVYGLTKEDIKNRHVSDRKASPDAPFRVSPLANGCHRKDNHLRFAMACYAPITVLGGQYTTKSELSDLTSEFPVLCQDTISLSTESDCKWIVFKENAKLDEAESYAHGGPFFVDEDGLWINWIPCTMGSPHKRVSRVRYDNATSPSCLPDYNIITDRTHECTLPKTGEALIDNKGMKYDNGGGVGPGIPDFIMDQEVIADALYPFHGFLNRKIETNRALYLLEHSIWNHFEKLGYNEDRKTTRIVCAINMSGFCADHTIERTKYTITGDVLWAARKALDGHGNTTPANEEHEILTSEDVENARLLALAKREKAKRIVEHKRRFDKRMKIAEGLLASGDLSMGNKKHIKKALTMADKFLDVCDATYQQEKQKIVEEYEDGEE